MSEEKMKIIEESAERYKELPEAKKMFVLGFMQGVLLNHEAEKEKAVEAR